MRIIIIIVTVYIFLILWTRLERPKRILMMNLWHWALKKPQVFQPLHSAPGPAPCVETVTSQPITALRAEFQTFSNQIPFTGVRLLRQIRKQNSPFHVNAS